MSAKQTEPRSVKPNSVAVADAYPITRFGLIHLLRQEPDLQVCGEAATAVEVLKLIRAAKPRLLLLDPSLQEVNGSQLIRTAKAEWPPLRVLVLSQHEESLHADLALHAGADGYIRKADPVEEILRAIRRVLDGQLYLNASLAERILRVRVDRRHNGTVSPVDLLSPRELEVFQLIGEWQRTQDIAKRMGLSVKTVEYYRHNIKEKLLLKNATQLTRFATEWHHQKAPSPPANPAPFPPHDAASRTPAGAEPPKLAADFSPAAGLKPFRVGAAHASP